MGLLLQVPAIARPYDEGIASTSGGMVPWTAPQPTEARALPQRRDLKARHQAQNYDNLFRSRLSHIPRPLPYGAEAILARLKEVDRDSPNHAGQDQRLELEADLTVLAHDMQRPAGDESARDRRERRLSNVWDYLVASTNRTKILVSERGGRLGFCTGMFFRSDLPAAFFAEYASSTFWEIAALIIATNASGQRLVQRVTERPAEAVNRDLFKRSDKPLQEIDRAFREYNERRLEVTSVSDRVLGWRDALEYYVDLFSAPTLRAFREPRPISTASLDQGVTEELTENLRSATADLRKLLAADYPGGVSELEWMSRDDPYVRDLLRLELEESQAV